MERIPYLFQIATIYLMSRGTSFSEICRSKCNMVVFSATKRGILYIINKCVHRCSMAVTENLNLQPHGVYFQPKRVITTPKKNFLVKNIPSNDSKQLSLDKSHKILMSGFEENPLKTFLVKNVAF